MRVAPPIPSRRTGRFLWWAPWQAALLVGGLSSLGCQHAWDEIGGRGGGSAYGNSSSASGDGGSGGSPGDGGGNGGAPTTSSLELTLAVCVAVSLSPVQPEPTLGDAAKTCAAWVTSKKIPDALGIDSDATNNTEYVVYLAFAGDPTIDPSKVASVALRLFVPDDSSIANGHLAGKLFLTPSFTLDSKPIPAPSMLLASTPGADGEGKILRGKPITWTVTPFDPSALDLRKPLYLAVQPQNDQPAFYAGPMARTSQDRPQLVITYK